jgi:hypothetical protein
VPRRATLRELSREADELGNYTELPLAAYAAFVDADVLHPWRSLRGSESVSGAGPLRPRSGKAALAPDCRAS